MFKRPARLFTWLAQWEVDVKRWWNNRQLWWADIRAERRSTNNPAPPWRNGKRPF